MVDKNDIPEKDEVIEENSKENSAETAEDKSVAEEYGVPEAPVIPETSKYNLPLDGADKHETFMHGMGKFGMVALAALLIAILGIGLLWLTHEEPVSQDTTQETQDAAVPMGVAVTFVEGSAEFHTGDELWQEIDSKTTLAQGNTIRTGSDSRIVVTVDDGSAIRLNSNSEATLTTLNNQLVEVSNSNGEIYTRVVASDTRTFTVLVGDSNYDALGTAYQTTNTADKKGVDVFHSSVKSGVFTVKEGKAFYTDHPNTDKVGRTSTVNIKSLSSNEFIKWNAELDKKEKDFEDKLGILDDLEKDEDKKDKPSPDPAPTGMITASAYKGSEGVKVKWEVNGVDTSNGFKVVYSKTSSTPTYKTDSAHYVGGSDATSAYIELIDGKQYKIRVCAYRPDQGTCVNYSNTVTVTSPIFEKEKVENGNINAWIDEDKIRWELEGGTAPYGFKVVYNDSGSPKYPVDNAKYTSDYKKALSEFNLDPGTYFFAICKYTSGTENEKCVDYSDDIEYTVL